jgi:hypothetical protein
LSVVHRLGFVLIVRPGIRNVVAPYVIFIFLTEERIFPQLSPCSGPELSVFSDALMSEEKSIIAEFTEVEVAKELDISYVNKFTVKCFWSGPAPHFEDS